MILKDYQEQEAKNRDIYGLPLEDAFQKNIDWSGMYPIIDLNHYVVGVYCLETEPNMDVDDDLQAVVIPYRIIDR